jgi:S-DNA-T family DNA segregation ATPase FtsK/SpoIIIE
MSGEYDPPPLQPAWQLPDITTIFNLPPTRNSGESNGARTVEDTLAAYGVTAQVIRIDRGPSITRYGIRPARGVRIAEITSLANELAIAFGVNSVRIEPISGISALGIEVPNGATSIVTIREIFECIAQRVSPLSIAIGKDMTGRPVLGDLTKMQHLLLGGTTGSGKSVQVHCVIASLLAGTTPDQLELMLVDTAGIELRFYGGIPHLKSEVIVDPLTAVAALATITREMDMRFERFDKAGVRTIGCYNAKFAAEKLPYIAVVIDELTDLMLLAPARVETLLLRLAELGCLAGIHLVVSTRSPWTGAITAEIKALMPSRIAFAVPARHDSRAILDLNGAEDLLGRGDMLYVPADSRQPIHVQGALVTSEEIAKLVAFWTRQAACDAKKEPQRDRLPEADELWYDAAKFLLDSRVAKGDAAIGSTAALQTRFSIGHPRAVHLMRQLEGFGVVSPSQGTSPRIVLIQSSAELERIAERIGSPPLTDRAG